ncbi:thioesterase II family protein [Streptosporangium sp. NPDC002607]
MVDAKKSRTYRLIVTTRQPMIILNTFLERQSQYMLDPQRASDLWIRRFTAKSGGQVRLVCFPHAGGSAGFFYPLSRNLEHPYEVVAVQYPGRQDRRSEDIAGGVEELADRIFEALKPWADVSLVLLGHSMGSIIAFEVARRLESSATGTLAGLIVSARRAPAVHHEYDKSPWTMHDAQAVSEAMGGTDPVLAADRSFMELTLPVLNGDYLVDASYRYRPGPPLRCPLTLFTGDSDPFVNDEETKGWGEHTAGRFRYRRFTGGHFYLTERRDAFYSALSEELSSFTM